MGDDDKPFLCSAVGCGQKFTNEDHLAVHMRKHEMSLALNLGTGGSTLKTPVGSGTGLFLDQTPTPTKFLKNCEEIGLFQELNKNPFEEAFKKAMDGSDAEMLPGPGSNELNTPIPPIPRTISDIGPPELSKNLINTHDDIVNLVMSHKRKLIKVESPQPTSTTSEDEVEVVATAKSDDAASPPSTLGSNSWANSSMLPINSLELPVVTAAQSTTLTKTTIATATTNTTNPIIHQPQPSAVTMQVYLQLPNGQTVPVQIPTATMSPALHVVQSTGMLQKLPGVITVPQQSQTQTEQTGTVTAQPLLVQSTVSSQTQTAITKQKLKAAIQQQTLPSPNKPTTQIIQVSPDTNHQQLRPATQIIQVSPDTNHQIRPATQIIQVSPDTNHQIRPATQIIQMSPDQNNHINNLSSTSNLICSSSAVAAISSPLSVETGSIASDGMSSPDRAESPFSQSKKFKRNSDGSEPSDDRRKKFLERNRAAAARCRQKRKNWINSLEKKADDMSSTNGRLQSEVNMLKAEVAQLKTLLLAHKDCPITLQQKSQGQFPTISVIEPVQVSEATVTNYQTTTNNDIDIVSTATNASWVQTQVITAVPSVQTQAVTMTTGNKITIIPRVIKTETTKPTRRK